MRYLDKNNLGQHEDWYGTNAAVSCTSCGKVFIVSATLHRKGRKCPACGLCIATATKQQVAISEATDSEIPAKQQLRQPEM
jgi:isoaspartyl peptidase/L-asparaginase-like protein (Ntn-hydrolase superfamily)